MPYPATQKVSARIRIKDGILETELMTDKDGKIISDELAQILILRDIIKIKLRDYENKIKGL